MVTSIAPALVIRVELEAAAPRVIAECANDAETAHLSPWLAEQPDLLLLVAHAIELEEEVEAV